MSQIYWESSGKMCMMNSFKITYISYCVQFCETLFFSKLSNRHGNIKITRILWFSAYTLAIFTEYTVWSAFGGMSRRALEMCLFYNRNANEVLNMRIWWWEAHMGYSYTRHYLHTKIRHCNPYRTPDICFLLLANQNRYANEILNMPI